MRKPESVQLTSGRRRRRTPESETTPIHRASRRDWSNSSGSGGVGGVGGGTARWRLTCSAARTCLRLDSQKNRPLLLSLQLCTADIEY